MEKERKAEEKRVFTAKGLLQKALRRFLLVLQGLGKTVVGASQAFWQVLEGEKKQSKKSLRQLLLTFVVGMGLFLGGMILSLAQFPLKVYPAGFALLSSLGPVGKKKRASAETAGILLVFCGVLFSCFFLSEYGLYYLLSYMILFFLRAGATGGRFDDSVLSRVTLSASVAVGEGILLSFLRHFSVNSVFAAVSAGLLTPVFTYLICGFYIYSAATSAAEGTQSRKRVYLEATVFTLEYLFLFSLREVELLGFRLSFVLAVMITLFFSRTRGALYGAAAGMIGGMASALSQASPALAVGGFFSGLFFEYSAPVAMMIAFVSSCGYCIYTEGFSSFALVTADYLCATLLFFPVLRFLPKREEGIKSVPGELVGREGVRLAKRKIRRMSDAFSSLSEVFYTVGETMKKPTITEVSRMVSDVCSHVCSRCALSGICWGEKQTLSAHATATVAAKLLASGRVEKEDFGPPFSGQCNRVETLTGEVMTRFAHLGGEYYKNNKTMLLAGEYSAVSRLLKSTAGVLDRELEFNPEFEKRAKRVLERLGIHHRRVAVFGTREMKIDVYGVALERVNLESDAIPAAFGKEFDCVFDDPAFLMFEEHVVMRLRRKRRIALECAKNGSCKRGEAVSGDSCLFFETDRDFFYTLICDGMGSGREAAFTSRLSSLFIEKLMHCATPKNVTLEMLNTFLMAKTDETFTTVDLLEIDLLSAKAHFIKAGAAPSYILRSDRLHRIESRTPPAGILTRMCAEQTAFSLQAGDFVIQMSDGVQGAGPEGAWLVGALVGEHFESAAQLCERIFHLAGEKGEGSDDLTVSVVRIMNS